MAMKLRLLQGATAALYMGPLLAGLAGFGWAMLPPFVSVFVLWLMLLRPHQWPQTNAEWLRPETWLAVLTQVVTQVLLVAVLFGVGRGIGGVLGHLPMFHPLLPVAVSFIAIPLSRLVWNAEQAVAQGLTIDELMYPRKSAPAAQPTAPEPRSAAVASAAAVQPLLDMADDAPLATLGSALEDVLEDDAAWANLAALSEALADAPQRHGALREALIIWATDPETFAANTAPMAMRTAFVAAGSDHRLLSRLLPRASALARIMPERHDLFPDRAALAALSGQRLPGQLASDLATLMISLGYRVGEDRFPRRGARGLTVAEAGTT